MKRVIAVEVISGLLILLFVYTAVSKLIDLEEFRIQTGQSPLLVDIAGAVVWIVPASELAIAFLLASFRWQLWGLYGSFLLMVIFTSYVFAILQFSEHIPCACGGVLQSMGWSEHLIFNLFFVLLSAWGIILKTREEKRVKDISWSLKYKGDAR